MQRVYEIVGLLGMIVLPLCIAGIVYRDCQHPQRWAQDPLRYDPRVYLPILAIPLGIAGTFAVRSGVRLSRNQAMLRSLHEAQRQLALGNVEGADRLYEAFKTRFRQLYGREPTP